MLQPTKNDTPHPKTKKKLWQDGRKDTIMIKPNLIPARWVTHKLDSSNINSSLTVGQVLSPASGFPAWGSSTGTGSPPEIWLWKPEGLHFHGTGGNRDFTLGGHKQNIAWTRTQGKGAVTPQETEPDLGSVGWSPAEMWAHRDLPQGQGIGSSSAGRNPLVGALLEANTDPSQSL